MRSPGPRPTSRTPRVKGADGSSLFEVLIWLNVLLLIVAAFIAVTGALFAGSHHQAAFGAVDYATAVRSDADWSSETGSPSDFRKVSGLRKAADDLEFAADVKVSGISDTNDDGRDDDGKVKITVPEQLSPDATHCVYLRSDDVAVRDC